MEEYNYDKLSQLVGSTVLIRDTHGNKAELTISEVNKGAIDSDEWEAFSVIYLGEKDISIPQGSYYFSHPDFSEQFLFLSPNSDTEFETVVTRKRQSVA